jgi:hypothetical protein
MQRMKQLVTLVLSLFLTTLVSAQGFPDAQKQPKMKEQHHNQKKYAKRAKRKHVKKGTVYMQDGINPNEPIWVCVLADDRMLLKNII